MNTSLIDYYYTKYKKHLLSIAIIVFSIFVITQFLIPQITSALQTREEMQLKQADIARLQESLNVVQNTPNEELRGNLEQVNKALPVVKDFLGIYLAIVSSASSSNIEVTNFASKIGTIYTTTGQKADAIGGQEFPTVKFTVEAKAGSINDLKTFADRLHETLPLAEVRTISVAEGSAEYEIEFFYKDLDLKKFAAQIDVKSLNAEQKKLLQKLQGMNSK